MSATRPVLAALGVIALGAVVVLFARSDSGSPSDADSGSPSDVVSTTLSPDPGYWTDERMRNARPVDTLVGPSVATLVVVGIAVVVGLAVTAFFVVRRRRSRSGG